MRRNAWEWTVEYFLVYKFRTMRVDADSEIHRDINGSLCASRKPMSEMQATAYKLRNDPRVTRMGRDIATG